MSALAATVFDLPFQVFWTAYDPLDLATDSIDPLGFLGPYVRLAEQLLPGLTTVTSVPRYVTLLCAAVRHAQDSVPETTAPRERRRMRLAQVKAFERAWALSCALASQESEIGEAGIKGLRGIRSVQRRLQNGGEAAIELDSFNMLTNQERYGCWGVYASMLESCHLLSIDDVELSSAGRLVAAQFPSPFFKLDPSSVLSRSKLRDWGKRAHLAGLQAKESASERKAIREALRGGDHQGETDRRRWTTMQALALFADDDSDELRLLKKVRDAISKNDLKGVHHPEVARGALAATVDLIAPFEDAYRGLLFVFQHLQSAATDEKSVKGGEQVDQAIERTQRGAKRLEAALDVAAGRCPEVQREVRTALVDAGLDSFLARIGACPTPEDAFELVLDRHEKVQRSKRDGGVPKTPWLVKHPKTGLRLTAQRFGLPATSRPGTWRDVLAHPYRTGSARAFISACEVEP